MVPVKCSALAATPTGFAFFFDTQHIGVKQDGSARTFGLDSQSNGVFAVTDFDLLPFHGTNWVSLFPLAALDDGGGLWASSNVWAYLQGQTDDFGPSEHSDTNVERHPGWRALAQNYNCLAEIDANGRLTMQDGWSRWWQDTHGDYHRRTYQPVLLGNWDQRFRRPSRYSDWLAAALCADSVVALAQDGTLCGWKQPHPDEARSRSSPPRAVSPGP